MSLSFPLTSNGTVYRARRAVIERSRFGLSDHGGVMTIELSLSYPDGGSGMPIFGGHALDAPSGNSERRATAYGMDFAMKVLSAAGVTTWEDVQGRACLVLFAAAASHDDEDNFWGAHPVGIAALEGDHVLIGEDHAALWAESRSPVPALGEELISAEQMCALRPGSLLRFSSVEDGATGVAIRRQEGWSATGLRSGMDDHAVWTKVSGVTYLGNSGDVSVAPSLKYGQLEHLAPGTPVRVTGQRGPGISLNNEDGSWSVAGMSTPLSPEEIWDMFSPISVLPSGSMDATGSDF